MTTKHPLWFDTAQQVRAKWPSQAESSVPTWFYGHEPSNLFASFIAKYFANSIREDGILAICYAGSCMLPDLQEPFKRSFKMHVKTTMVHANISPMVFLDKEYWSETKPVYRCTVSTCTRKGILVPCLEYTMMSVRL